MRKPRLLTKENVDTYFEYATSARETTAEWAEDRITTKKWLQGLYWKPARNFVKNCFKRYGGIRKTKTQIRAALSRVYGKDYLEYKYYH
jgi:hypothetical protein